MIAKVLPMVLINFLLCCCNVQQNEEGRGATIGDEIRQSTKVEIRIIPDRKSDMSFKAREISDQEEIVRIADFVQNVEPKHPPGFASLPDGYLSLYQGSAHKLNIYFVLDSSNGSFQVLEDQAELKITEAGVDYLRRIYLDNSSWEPKEIE